MNIRRQNEFARNLPQAGFSLSSAGLNPGTSDSIRIVAMTSRRQFVRFATVGLGSNIALYLLYLLATSNGMGHKTAMSSIYVLGLSLTFVFNRSWSFQHNGTVSAALIRYAIAYISGYFLNLAMLSIGVDRLHLPHQIVQAIAIVTVAGTLFLAHRYWVFPSSESRSTR